MPSVMSGGEDLFGLVGYQLDGKYQVDAAVARGGFGVVYRARHIALLTQHAVKVLRTPPGLPEEMQRRFLTQFVEEARIIAQFQHPAVVKVTDFGVSLTPSGEQAPWMVLEWIEGVTLGEHLNARRGQGGRSPREVLDLLYPVLDALAAAHDMGIAHRDIKPANIMLPSDTQAASMRGSRRGGGARPTARVLDFGIAKLMSEGEDGPASGQTRTSSLMPAFSPRYASPEQLSGTRTGPWTDVHALGLILTEMLTDRAPFDHGDKLKLATQVMSERRPTPAKFGVDVGPWEPVLARALALTPSDRFPNAGEFLTALEAEVPSASRLLATSSISSVASLTASSTSSPSIVISSDSQGHETLHSQAVVADISTLRPSTVPRVPQARSRRTPLLIAVALLALIAGTVAFAVRMRGAASSGVASSPHAVTPAPETQPTPAPAALIAPQPAAQTAPPTAPVAQTQVLVAPAQTAPPTAPAESAPPRTASGRAAPIERGATAGRHRRQTTPLTTTLYGMPPMQAPAPAPVAPPPPAPAHASTPAPENPLE